MPVIKTTITTTPSNNVDIMNTIHDLISTNSGSINTVGGSGSDWELYTFPSEGFSMEMEILFNDNQTYCRPIYTLSHDGYQHQTNQIYVPGSITYNNEHIFNCYCSDELTIISFVDIGSNSRGVFGWIKPEFKPSQLDTSIYPWGFIIGDEFATYQNQFVSVYYTPYTQSGYSGQQIKNVFDSWLHGNFLREPDPQHGNNIDVLAGLVIFKPNDRGIAAKSSNDLGIANVGNLQGFPEIDLGVNGIYQVCDSASSGQKLVVRIS